jgi:glycine C-acetyltransferase
MWQLAPASIDRLQGKARVRTIVTAEHTGEELAEALDVFERVGRELELL